MSICEHSTTGLHFLNPLHHMTLHSSAIRGSLLAPSHSPPGEPSSRCPTLALFGAAVLFGAACLVMEERIFARTGPPSGMKAVAYLLILPLTIPLPLSLGVNLLWHVVSWRRFAGGWLVVWGSINLACLLGVSPGYRFELLPYLALASPGVAFVAAGLFLVWKS